VAREPELNGSIVEGLRTSWMCPRHLFIRLSGANVLAAIQIGRRRGAAATVDTLMVDSGLKYMSTDVYRRDSNGVISRSR